MKRLSVILALLLCLTASAGPRKAVVLFVQFPDMEFTYSYPEFNAFTDSLTLYFNDQFHGNPEFSFTRGPVITLDRNHNYYGANTSSYSDDQMFKGVIEACRIASDSLDLSEFLSENGTLRDILLMLPGKSEVDTSARDAFLPQYVEFASRNYYPYVDGKRLLCYACATEMDSTRAFTGIGNMAHEYSHILGLADYYDTDGERSGGTSKALWGSLGLMDRGNASGSGHCPPNWCAPDFYTIGAGAPEVIDSAGTYTLEPIHLNGQYFVFPGPHDGEVFLAESRINEGWDSLIGGRGMVIYHYDRSDGDALWSDWDGQNLTASQRWRLNRVNCNPEHPCVEVMAPDTLSPFFPFEGKDAFSSETAPSFHFWDGTASAMAISGITQAPDGTVSFNLSRPLGGFRVLPFQTSVILSWQTDENITGIDSCVVICSSGADTLARGRAIRGKDSSWGYCFDSLKPTTTYRITVQIMRGGTPFWTARTYATTLSVRKGLFPFIYFRAQDRNADGRFNQGARIPLQVFNAAEAAEIRWFFQGAEAKVSPDGYFTIPGPGTLTAEIHWEDGSIDLITKEITLE